MLATNTTGSYCHSKISHVSYNIIFITACRPTRNVRLQYDLKRVDAGATHQ